MQDSLLTTSEIPFQIGLASAVAVHQKSVHVYHRISQAGRVADCIEFLNVGQ